MLGLCLYDLFVHSHPPNRSVPVALFGSRVQSLHRLRLTAESRDPQRILAWLTASLVGAGLLVVLCVRQSSWRTRAALIGATLLIVLLMGARTVTALGRVPAGTTVGTLQLGGLSYPEASRRISDEAATFDSRTVTLVFGSNSWTPTLKDLGITIDQNAATHLLVQPSGPIAVLRSLFSTAGLGSGPIALSMPLTVDPAALQTYCADRLREMGLAPVDAELRLDGQSLVVTQDQSGYVVAVDQVRGDLLREITGFTAPTINLAATFSRASVATSQLQPQLDAIQASLSQPLVLSTITDEWQISPGQLASHFSIDSSSGEPSISFDEAAIETLVQQLAVQIDHPVREASIDSDGGVARLLDSEAGVMVNQPALTQQIEDAISAGSHHIDIPVFTMAATTDATSILTEKGVIDVLATGTSDFSGSDDRRSQNVRVAAKKVDGSLVGPGDTFSFNHALGSITEDAGFVSAGATEGGIPGTSVGGGVCQISTTVFRAALEAGLPIVEWWPHTFRSTFYEQGGWTPGFDASIQQDDTATLAGADFSFTNTTSHWILIRVSVSDDDVVTVQLVGTDPGWSVQISDPQYGAIVPSDEAPVEEVDPALPAATELLYQPARDGVTMTVHRTVFDADGNVLIDEDYVSTYQPQGAIYRVSADYSS